MAPRTQRPRSVPRQVLWPEVEELFLSDARAPSTRVAQPRQSTPKIRKRPLDDELAILDADEIALGRGLISSAASTKPAIPRAAGSSASPWGPTYEATPLDIGYQCRRSHR